VSDPPGGRSGELRLSPQRSLSTPKSLTCFHHSREATPCLEEDYKLLDISARILVQPRDQDNTLSCPYSMDRWMEQNISQKIGKSPVLSATKEIASTLPGARDSMGLLR
jgi:hypothetical protein